MHLTQEICNPKNKKNISIREIIKNINDYFDCEIASITKENYILIDSGKTEFIKHINKEEE